jgi:diacylglycerol kinase (ATP)
MINRWIKASRNTFDGLKVLCKERAFREEIILSLIALIVIYFMPLAGILKLILILLLMLLPLVEAINSAIEAIVDRISTEIHPLSKIAKDIGSAAVAIALVMNIIAWCFAIFAVISS